MKTSNLTIVFTDIKGFTERTGRQSHEENQGMLRLHDALLMPVFRAFDGRLVKTIGDAFMVVFHSPTKAVLAGVAIQDRLWEHNRQVPKDQQIHVRVAANMGEAREERGDVFGEPVNIAARIESIAEAGEVLFTEAVFLSMNKAEVPAEEHGVHQLKGISRPVRVYRVPKGNYELSARNGAGSTEDLGATPPYGGIGLARAGKLPPTDTASLAKHTELGPRLLAATTMLAGDLQRALVPHRTAGSLQGVVQRLFKRPPSVSADLGARPAWALLGLAAAAVLVVSLLYLFIGRGDAVERAIARGDAQEARAQLKRMPPGPARGYDEGVIEEFRGSFGRAASSYEGAARAGDHRGYKRLVRMTQDARCSARSSAAHALGQLGDKSAVSALNTLQKTSFGDEGDDSTLGSIFGCSSRRAAREALARFQAD